MGAIRRTRTVAAACVLVDIRIIYSSSVSPVLVQYEGFCISRASLH